MPVSTCGLGLLDRGGGRLELAGRIVEVLLAKGHSAAVRGLMRSRFWSAVSRAASCRARAALGLIELHLKRFLVHQKERVALLDDRAFGIDPLVQKAADPRLNVHLPRALRLGDILEADRHILLRDGHDRHFRRRAAASCSFLHPESIPLTAQTRDYTGRPENRGLKRFIGTFSCSSTLIMLVLL